MFDMVNRLLNIEYRHRNNLCADNHRGDPTGLEPKTVEERIYDQIGIATPQIDQLCPIVKHRQDTAMRR